VRLTEQQLNAIRQIFQKYFYQEDKIWLFGSRTDSSKKGGDIDLYIETQEANLTKIVRMQLDFLTELKQKIGEQKIDVIINSLPQNKHLPIYDEAKNTGILI